MNESDIEKLILYSFDTLIDNIDETMIVALIEGKVVGTVHLQHKGRQAAFFRMLYVHEDWRRLGIASMLIKECYTIASNEGCETIGLLVEKENDTATSMYRELGFLFVYEYDDGSKLMSRILNHPNKLQKFRNKVCL